MSDHTPDLDLPQYNATVTAIRQIHEDLLILRVRPDTEVPQYKPGQYTTLGLLTDAPHVPTPQDADELQPQQGAPGHTARHPLIRRAYSISCPILTPNGTLVGNEGLPFLEFYIALVRGNTDRPPTLTPRIFALEVGHRIFMGPSPKGTYTLDPVGEDDDVIFVATGTGEAPHNAMIQELLFRQHRGRIASFVCVRHQRDLGYLQTHRQLESQFHNYHYVPLTTREPENIDRRHPRFVGKRYLQDLFSQNPLPLLPNWSLQPDSTHVFLCGNPAMIGAPQPAPNGQHVFPEPKGMVETLSEQGFRRDQPQHKGNLHFERYW